MRRNYSSEALEVIDFKFLDPTATFSTQAFSYALVLEAASP